MKSNSNKETLYFYFIFYKSLNEASCFYRNYISKQSKEVLQREKYNKDNNSFQDTPLKMHDNKSFAAKSFSDFNNYEKRMKIKFAFVILINFMRNFIIII